MLRKRSNALIGEAFQPLQVTRWLVPDPVRRAVILPAVFRIFVDHALAHGQVHIIGDQVGLAVWLRRDAEPLAPPARVLQHELDHLDGVLFPQRIADDYHLLWCSTERYEQFTAYLRACRRGEKPSWHTRTPRDQWDVIQAGVAVLGTLVEVDETDPADGHPDCPATSTMPPANRKRRT